MFSIVPDDNSGSDDYHQGGNDEGKEHGSRGAVVALSLGLASLGTGTGLTSSTVTPATVLRSLGTEALALPRSRASIASPTVAGKLTYANIRTPGGLPGPQANQGVLGQGPDETVGPGSGGTTQQSIAFYAYSPEFEEDIPVRIGNSGVGWYHINVTHGITNPQVVIQTIEDGTLIRTNVKREGYGYVSDEYEGEFYIGNIPTPIYTYTWVVMGGGDFVNEFVSPIGVTTTFCGGYSGLCSSIINSVSG
jgi:hypothetical protein